MFVCFSNIVVFCDILGWCFWICCCSFWFRFFGLILSDIVVFCIIFCLGEMFRSSLLFCWVFFVKFVIFFDDLDGFGCFLLDFILLFYFFWFWRVFISFCRFWIFCLSLIIVFFNMVFFVCSVLIILGVLLLLLFFKFCCCFILVIWFFVFCVICLLFDCKFIIVFFNFFIVIFSLVDLFIRDFFFFMIWFILVLFCCISCCLSFLMFLWMELVLSCEK